MALQYSTAVRNAKLAAIMATVGASAILKFRTGAPPANCAAADTGSVVATLNLPATWMGTPSAGSVAKAGTWEDTAADAAGTIGHFRVYASDGSTCGIQGTVTDTAGSGDIKVQNTVVAAGQDIIVTGFTIADNNG